MSRARTLGLLLSLAILAGPGCSGRYAQEGAKQGAGTGAVYGAVWGAVRGLLWGGDVLEGAAVGAAAGAAGGAAVGALEGSRKDSRIEAQIGPDVYRAGVDFVECRHQQALTGLTRARGSEVYDHRLAALWIEAAVHDELRDREKLAEITSLLVEEDGDVDDAEDARLEIRLLLREVRETRVEFEIPARCGLR